MTELKQHDIMAARQRPTQVERVERWGIETWGRDVPGAPTARNIAAWGLNVSGAPKARDIVAWGNAPGIKFRERKRAEGPGHLFAAWGRN